MASSTRWIRDFTPPMLDEVERALRAAQSRGLKWHQVTRADFDVPRTAALLAEAAEELENGSGMMKLRGLPVARYTEDELRIIWFGLGSVLGTPLFQNRSGELMRAIRDEGTDVGKRYGQIEKGDNAPFISSYARTLSNGALRYHTDRCDVVGLLCVRQARAGGVSKLASSPAVHNTMLERRPDLAAALYQPIWRSRLGEELGGEKIAYPLPIFGQRDGRFTSHYSLTYIEAAQLLDEVPRLTATQREAIDVLMQLAEELSFEMTMEPGVIQLLNNHVIYHGRTPFENDSSSGQDRLLLRLWLGMPNSRALPEDHAVLWRNVAAGVPHGGIGQAVPG
ncbi:MAG TPA: TauD/TfdA family dioxygenase [Alphaproteobacteria bacterium]|nr:TauD/TfdA family dioxygenase [Alphaproteobacteria bacterium]